MSNEKNQEATSVQTFLGGFDIPFQSQKPHKYNFSGIELTTLIDDNGEFWFVAKDIAQALEYSDAHKMTSKLDPEEIQNRQIGGFGNRGVNLINESGLFSSILRSKKPSAKKFKKWVTSELLPSIRKTGSYELKAPTVETLQIDNTDLHQKLHQSQQEVISLYQYKVKQLENQARKGDLTENEINAIITLEQNDYSQSRIAKIVGRSRRTVGRVLKQHWGV